MSIICGGEYTIHCVFNGRGKIAAKMVLSSSFIETVSSEDDLIAREAEVVAALNPAYNFNRVFADNPMKGKRHSPESLEKMSRSKRGKKLGPRKVPFSKEVMAKISRALKGRPSPRKGMKLGAAARATMSAAAKRKFAGGFVNGRTRAVEIAGQIFPSGTEAAAVMGIAHGTLIANIKRGYGRYAQGGITQLKEWKPYKHPSGAANPKSRPVIVDGKEFPSLTAAACHFGKRVSTMTYWLQRGYATYADGTPPAPLRAIYKPF